MILQFALAALIGSASYSFAQVTGTDCGTLISMATNPPTPTIWKEAKKNPGELADVAFFINKTEAHMKDAATRGLSLEKFRAESKIKNANFKIAGQRSNLGNLAKYQERIYLKYLIQEKCSDANLEASLRNDTRSNIPELPNSTIYNQIGDVTRGLGPAPDTVPATTDR